MVNNKYPISRLTRDEFVSALHKGLGRAFLYVKKYRLVRVSDLVLQACLHYPVQGLEAGGGYSKWIFSMFHKTRHYAEFSKTILHALETEMNPSDLEHLFALAKEMAITGDEQAKSTIRKRALYLASIYSNIDYIGAREWIEVGGITGLLELVRIYSQRILNNPEDENIPVWELLDNEIHLIFENNLPVYIQKEPILKAYSDYLLKYQYPQTPSTPAEVEARKQRLCEDTRRRFSLESILDDAKNKRKDYPGDYGTFGRYATKQELAIIYSHLLNETDEEVCLRLLWVFSRTPVPALSEKLFLLAEETNDRLKGASLKALAQVMDNRIHKLALKNLLRVNLLGSNRNTMNLFILNYEKGDGQLISDAVISLLPNIEEADDISHSIRDVAKRHKDSELAGALKWAYENTTSPLCRYGIIIELDAISQFTDAILCESQYDSDEDIRSLAKNKPTESFFNLPT